MTQSLRHRIARFRQNEDGNSTIEFVIMFPLFIFLLLAGIEMSVIAIRQATLERAMDMTVRDIRLSDGSPLQHNAIKQALCDRAVMVPNCAQNLKLEMIRIDLRNWSGLPATPDCVDHAEPSAPVRSFVNGTSNELMILRACAKFKPYYPLSGIGHELSRNNTGANAGYAAVTVTTAFVQEPQ